MPMQTLAARIAAAETALQAAWQRRDGEAARQLREQLAALWSDRRAELARMTHTRACDWSRTVDGRAAR